MTRLRDIMTGTNTLKGAADLAIVHVADVVKARTIETRVESGLGLKLKSYEVALKDAVDSMIAQKNGGRRLDSAAARAARARMSGAATGGSRSPPWSVSRLPWARVPEAHARACVP